MLATPTSSNTATRALRSAGLISGEKDVSMRDLSSKHDRQGGRKGTQRSKHRTLRPASLAIKGTATVVTATPATRIRRNAVSSSDSPSVNSRIPVRTATTGTKGSITGQVAQWKEVVESRWNPATRFLNLEHLADSPIVQKYKLRVPGSGGDAKDAAVIFKLAGQLRPAVQTISLANNGLTGSHLTHLARYLPKILNLSLANNKLHTLKDTDNLTARSRHRFLHLRELVLTGNPLIAAIGIDRYRSELGKRISTLGMLDQEPLATQIVFDNPFTEVPDVAAIRPTSTTFPAPMCPSFVDGVDPSLVPGFLARYFSLPAGSPEIGFAYAPNALFSYQANTNIPIRARILGLHTSPSLPNQSKLTWTAWHASGSRNLVKVASSTDKNLKSLHTGQAEICAALQMLPSMKVDMGDGKSVLDAFPVPLGGEGVQGLMVSVHGEFVEGGSEGVRSFDRTFILSAGSTADLPPNMTPWPVTILSDQLTIRAYSSPAVWTVGDMPVLATKSLPMPSGPKGKGKAPAPPGTAPSAATTVTLDNLPPDQRTLLSALPPNDVTLVLTVINRTLPRLNVHYAIECLKGNQGDVERALIDFENVKGGLPPDAFLSL
ncbi:hypothetical protein DL96DRAFT_1589657 [Flagelloscypha sp. PMI_526]|nr:hypothetical protein DL96DRAFT_1589657 [Flagelloscypha sp. PMI_526]